jgi:hypothetical protein
MPQSWDMGQILSLPFRRRACGGFSDARKIQRLRPGLNPRTVLLIGACEQSVSHPTDHYSLSPGKSDGLLSLVSSRLVSSHKDVFFLLGDFVVMPVLIAIQSA